MSAALMVSFRAPVLPWAGSDEDDTRFKRVMRYVFIVCALLILAELFLPLVMPEPTKSQEQREQITALIIDNVKQLPPPPIAEEITKPDLSKSNTKATDTKTQETVQKAKPAPDARNPLPNKPSGEIDAARRKASGVGLLAMANDIAEMHGAPMAVQLAPVKPGAGVGTGAGVGVGAGNEAGLPDRSMITSNASGGSGGINTSGYSKNTGGGGLAGRSTTLVAGAVAGGGGGAGHDSVGTGNGTGSGAQGASKGGNLQRGNGGKASRSIEEIKLVFEKNKGAIYAIYNRALREEPGLQGKVVLKLKIAPAGNVIDCRIESSELKSPELEAKLLARIRQFDFGAKDVNEMDVSWPVDFLPS